MNIAFYAPLKSPRSDTPSGDREIARLLWRALSAGQAGVGGHEVTLASDLRTFEGAGDAHAQQKIKVDAARAAEDFIANVRRGGRAAPALWFTYHTYHKAPDLIGPAVTAALGIPYVIVEASISPKQASGSWAAGHAATVDAVRSADCVIGLNPRDAKEVRKAMRSDATYLPLAPFIDTSRFDALAAATRGRPHALAHRHDDAVRVLTVAMMREGDKYASYMMLRDALLLCRERAWHLTIVGDGAMRFALEAAFASLGDQVTFAGALNGADLVAAYGAADVFAWPACNEALGMVFLEAGAAGLPVVAGHTDGVASIVKADETGLFAPAGSVDAFASALDRLIADEALRRRLGHAARRHVLYKHGLPAASARLCEIVTGLVSNSTAGRRDRYTA
ncbi:MAG: glycosyltransferase family 4 protein [Pseudomonadota bacterium]